MASIVYVPTTEVVVTTTENVSTIDTSVVLNQVTVSNLQGPQGAKGDTGATGATGATGSSGVVTVNTPLTNAGTSTAANLSVSAGSTSAAGVLQLTNSVSSTSTTTAATPAAVKTTYDLMLTKMAQVKVPVGSYVRSLTSVGSYAPQITHQTLYLTPILISVTQSFDRIAMFSNGGITSGTLTLRMGIYGSDSNNNPSSLVLDAGTVVLNAGHYGFASITINQSLTPGIYWVGLVPQGTAPGGTPSYFGCQSAFNNINAVMGAVSATPSGNNYAGYSIASTTGALPSTATGYVGAVTLPYVWLRGA